MLNCVSAAAAAHHAAGIAICVPEGGIKGGEKLSLKIKELHKCNQRPDPGHGEKIVHFSDNVILFY